MAALRELLAHSESLLLFLVIGLGFLAGQIRVRGFNLGVAGVLFVGLAFGAWQPTGTEPLAIAPQVSHVGLILFVYAVGLTSGPGFFASLRRRGIEFNIAVIAALVLGGVLTHVLGRLMALPVGQVAGVFCGSLTNTPALAAVTELMSSHGIADPEDPAVGYSMAYPFGVIGGLLAFQFFAHCYRDAAAKERADAERIAREKTLLSAAHFEVTNPEIAGQAIGALRVQEKTGLIISRHRHGDQISIPTKYTLLQPGDVVLAVGSEVNLAKGEAYFGATSKENLKRGDEQIMMRRVLVSKKSLAGKTIGELELDRRFNAQITRLRRADIDIVPQPKDQLEIGDRLRVVMPKEKTAEVAAFFGDSERSISELDYTALTLGISIGVLLGMVPIPVPGGESVSLGFAGGPLVAGLILGRLGRSGPLVWSIPLESNQALRHIGLLFFLAGVGILAGGRFFDALTGSGWKLVLLGAMTTCVTTAATLILLRRYAKATVVSAIGATSGMQTQPATLARAYEMSKSEETYVAYATTYPVAMVGKILIAQLLVLLGRL